MRRNLIVKMQKFIRENGVLLANDMNEYSKAVAERKKELEFVSMQKEINNLKTVVESIDSKLATILEKLGS